MFAVVKKYTRFFGLKLTFNLNSDKNSAITFINMANETTG